MRILPIIGKDLRIYFRQRKTLLLMFLTPILIMLVIGSVFSDAAPSGLKDVKLGISGYQTPMGEKIIESLSKEGMFTIVEEANATPEAMEAKVKNGEYSAGIILPTNGSRAIKLYIDNSQLQVAPVVASVFLTVTEKISYEITLGFIEHLWTNLEKMEAQMEPLEEEVKRVNATINDINSDTKQIKASLDGLNTTGLKSSLSAMEAVLDGMAGNLTQSRHDLIDTRREILELNSSISTINSDSSELRDELKIVVDNIEATDQALLELQTGLKNVYNSTCWNQSQVFLNPQCVSINQSIEQIAYTKNLLSNRTSRIVSLYENLDNVANTSAELQVKLSEIDARLERMDASIVDYISDMQDIRVGISPIEETITSVEEIREQAGNTFALVDSITHEINVNSAKLVKDIEESKSMLREVLARHPAAVIAPVTLERYIAFEERSRLDFLMPGIIAIVLMFVCFLLASITVIQEKSGGTLARTIVSPISLHELLIAKMIALLVISFIQALILLGIARFLYGIVLPTAQFFPLIEAVVVYSIAFISIGMVIAAFADSENTAMLSSLVLSIPMLFLCGVFFPFEMMPPAMAAFGSALPITLGVELFKDILVYQNPITPGNPLRLAGYSAVAYAIAYLEMRYRLQD